MTFENVLQCGCETITQLTFANVLQCGVASKKTYTYPKETYIHTIETIYIYMTFETVLQSGCDNYTAYFCECFAVWCSVKKDLYIPKRDLYIPKRDLYTYSRDQYIYI